MHASPFDTFSSAELAQVDDAEVHLADGRRVVVDQADDARAEVAVHPQLLVEFALERLLVELQARSGTGSRRRG